MENQKDQKQQSPKLGLYWIDTVTGKKYAAGVGFFLPEYGEFRLKIDGPWSEGQVFVKPVNGQNDRVNYRVEVVIKSGGRFSHRSEIGSGYMDKNTGGFIYMDLGPFSRCLALEVET